MPAGEAFVGPLPKLAEQFDTAGNNLLVFNPYKLRFKKRIGECWRSIYTLGGRVDRRSHIRW